MSLDVAASNGDDVLEGTSKRDTDNVRHHRDGEVWAAEEEGPLVVVERRVLGGQADEILGVTIGNAVTVDVAVGKWLAVLVPSVDSRGVVGNGGLAPLLVGDLAGNVGTAKGAAVDVEALADVVGNKLNLVVGDRDTLDAADAASIWRNVILDLPADVANELVGKVEDKDARVLDGVYQRGVGDNVVRQRDAREVLDVLVVCVDDMGELLGLLADRGIEVLGVLGEGDVLLVNPHLDILLEGIGVLGAVLSNELGHGGAPVTGTDDGNLVLLGVVVDSHFGGLRVSADEEVSCIVRTRNKGGSATATGREGRSGLEECGGTGCGLGTLEKLLLEKRGSSVRRSRRLLYVKPTAERWVDRRGRKR